MIKSFKYRLFPTKTQKVLLDKHFGCCRFIYNWALEKKTKAYQLDKTKISRFELQSHIPHMKKTIDYQWLKEVNSLSIQAKLEDLDKAFVLFFRKQSNYPNFKCKKSKQSFRIPQHTKVNFKSNIIKIPKFQEGIKFDGHRKFKGKISSSFVSKTSTSKYYISICVKTDDVFPIKPKIKEKSTIGIDLGISHFATISNGEKVDNPRHLKNKLKKLKRQQRQLSKKQKGSNNRNKQKLIISKIYEKITNCRKDFQHKLSHKMTHDNQVDTIIMETLSIKEMMKNKYLSQSIADAGWYQFQEFVKYKCDWYGKNFIQIGKYEPSSKLCTCGEINHELKLKDRHWTCKSCGRTHDRDILASNNIKQIGLVRPKSTPRKNCKINSLNGEITN